MIRKNEQSEAISFATLDGQTARVPLVRRRLFKEILYSVSHDRVETVGALIGTAIGAIPDLVKEALIHDADAGRILTILHRFRDYVFFQDSQATGQPAPEMKVSRLSRVLRAWILSLLGDDDRMLPLLGLEGAYFLECIAFGATSSEDEQSLWTFTGVAEPDTERDNRLNDNASWKQRFTAYFDPRKERMSWTAMPPTSWETITVE